MNAHQKRERRGLNVVYLAVLAGVVLLAAFCRWQNNGIIMTHIVYTGRKVPSAFNGFRILHISDLHNKCFGDGQKKIAEYIIHAKPDIIAVTGDIIDKRREGTAAAMRLACLAARIAPVYYVPGNHEKSAGVFEKLSARLTSCGVFVVGNDSAEIVRDGAKITLLGVKDREFFWDDWFYEHKLNALAQHHQSGFRLLLSHRPEKMDLYAQMGFDLVLTGHAHGGQFRLPLIGGLYAPHQGVFPKYTSGLYRKGSTSMVVSRGLGNSAFPLRLFNRPELVIITLKRG
jgi:predicted MPP superfamily phosphohydrolase